MRRRVPNRGYYGGAKTFRGSNRAQPAWVATDQFEAPRHSDGTKTYVKAGRKPRREKP